jgi:hypothetical protein
MVYVSAGLADGDLVSLTTLDSSFDGSEVRIQSRVRTDELMRSTEPDRQSVDRIGDATAAVQPGAENTDG